MLRQSYRTDDSTVTTRLEHSSSFRPSTVSLFYENHLAESTRRSSIQEAIDDASQNAAPDASASSNTARRKQWERETREPDNTTKATTATTELQGKSTRQ